jgi:C4-dicarboxylate-specific signal transduction histidine kinase
MPVSAGTVVTVLDGDERIVLRSRDGARFVGETMPWTGGQPDAAQPDVDGVERLSTTARLGAAPWRVVVGIARGQVFERVLAIWRRNLLLAMLALGASFGIALIVSIRLSAHIERLRTAAARIAAGDLTPLEPDVMPSRELEELQQAFVTMAARLREARDAHARQVDQERAMNEHLQSLQRHLVRQERVAAVGQLAAGVAHELNNPLQAILGAAEMLERNRGMNADALEDVAFVKGQALRARNTIRSLSRFSTAPPTTLQPVDLRDVIAEVLQLRAPQLAALRVKVTVHPGSMRPVAGSFTELAQVVLHLLANAEQALLAGGTEAPRIDVRLFDAGPRVRLEVHDNGPGVPAEHESRLFQPFFTTRLVGEGAGLALSASHGIVHSYGGTIGYFRNEAGGATFYFELPVMDAVDHGHDRAAVLRRPVGADV